MTSFSSSLFDKYSLSMSDCPEATELVNVSFKFILAFMYLLLICLKELSAKSSTFFRLIPQIGLRFKVLERTFLVLSE